MLRQLHWNARAKLAKLSDKTIKFSITTLGPPLGHIQTPFDYLLSVLQNNNENRGNSIFIISSVTERQVNAKHYTRSFAPHQWILRMHTMHAFEWHWAWMMRCRIVIKCLGSTSYCEYNFRSSCYCWIFLLFLLCLDDLCLTRNQYCIWLRPIHIYQLFHLQTNIHGGFWRRLIWLFGSYQLSNSIITTKNSNCHLQFAQTQ